MYHNKYKSVHIKRRMQIDDFTITAKFGSKVEGVNVNFNFKIKPIKYVKSSPAIRTVKVEVPSPSSSVEVETLTQVDSSTSSFTEYMDDLLKNTPSPTQLFSTQSKKDKEVNNDKEDDKEKKLSDDRKICMGLVDMMRNVAEKYFEGKTTVDIINSIITETCYPNSSSTDCQAPSTSTEQKEIPTSPSTSISSIDKNEQVVKEIEKEKN